MSGGIIMKNNIVSLETEANYLLVFTNEEGLETESLMQITLLEAIDYNTKRPDFIYLLNKDNTIGQLIWQDNYDLEMVK